MSSSFVTGVKYRLAGGGRNHGRVEVAYDGVWGTVCNWFWSSQEARIFCRQLGFKDGQALRSEEIVVLASGPVWLNYVNCGGHENTILECSNSGWNVQKPNSCRLHKWDAAARCFNEELSKYRIPLIKHTVQVEVGKSFCRSGAGNLLFYRTPQWVPIEVYWPLSHLHALSVQARVLMFTSSSLTRITKSSQRKYILWQIPHLYHIHTLDLYLPLWSICTFPINTYLR